MHIPPTFYPTVKVRVVHNWIQQIVDGFLVGAKKMPQWQQLYEEQDGQGHGVWVDIEAVHLPEKCKHETLRRSLRG